MVAEKKDRGISWDMAKMWGLSRDMMAKHRDSIMRTLLFIKKQKNYWLLKPNSWAYNFVEFLYIILRVLRLSVSYVYITNPSFKLFLHKGGGVVEVTVNSKEENSQIIFSQLRPRIWPLESSGFDHVPVLFRASAMLKKNNFIKETYLFCDFLGVSRSGWTKKFRISINLWLSLWKGANLRHFTK